MRTRVIGGLLLTAGICGATLLARGAEPPAGQSPAAAQATAPAAPAPVAVPDSFDPTATQQAPARQGPDQQYWGFLEHYCSKCHNATDWAGGIAFDTMQSDGIWDDAKTWEKAMVKLRGRLMPPPGNPEPGQPSVDAFVHWMESNLDKVEAAHPNPGRVALHRLNRKEYANAVRDLLAVQVNAEAILPQDDQADGFDNIANVLQVSPAFLDQYLSAARAVAVQAIGDPTPRPVGTQYHVPADESQFFHVEGLPLGTRGGMQVVHEFPADGEYELNIANMAVALWVFNMEFRNTVIATLDGKKFFETNIGGEEDMKAIDQKQDPAVDAINARLKGIRFHATAGPHKVAVTFLHRTFAESDARLEEQVPGGGQDRVLRLQSFEIKGPFKVSGLADTPSRRKIFICRPKSAAEEEPCAERITSTLAERAFRRPVGPQELTPLMAICREGTKEGGFEQGIRRVVTAILASPFFLYRAEPAPQNIKAGGTYRVSDLELASRLSFFLWSSIPDDELLKLAEQNRLHEPAVLKAQVLRMLADPRSISLASNFAFQWLGVDRLAEIKPDTKLFPYVVDPRDDFRTELKLFVDSIFRENKNVLDLMTANYTFVNQRLALLYGINNVRGDRFRRVTLTDSHRFGLLGKGAFLMGTSYPNRTAPVLRGEWILDRVTGTPPAAPPPAVPSLKENKDGEKPHTVREAMALHRSKPSCFACHGVLDPLGLAFENFDAVGRWRTKDRIAETPIDASGVLPDGTKVNGPDDVRAALLRRPDQFVQTLVEKLMTFGLGRTLDFTDMATVRTIVREAALDHDRFDSIVLDIVNSPPFQYRTVPAVNTAPHVQQAALIR